MTRSLAPIKYQLDAQLVSRIQASRLPDTELTDNNLVLKMAYVVALALFVVASVNAGSWRVINKNIATIDMGLTLDARSYFA